LGDKILDVGCSDGGFLEFFGNGSDVLELEFMRVPVSYLEPRASLQCPSEFGKN